MSSPDERGGHGGGGGRGRRGAGGGGGRGGAGDALRLAFGTLTVLPVPRPGRIDRGVAGWAMALAPVVGAVLGLAALVLARVAGLALGPLVVAVLVVAVVAVLTRLIHWDGLADTADGIGSGRPAADALEIMRRGDVGPFGVLAIVVVFALQVGALSGLLARGVPTAVVVALVLGRGALLVACRTGVPPARPDGLGAAVAGSVGHIQLVCGALAGTAVFALAVVADPRLAWPTVLVGAVLAVCWALGATWYLRRRLGGMTGDTLGALVETTTAVALVVLAAA